MTVRISRLQKGIWAIPLLLVACVTVNVYFPAPAVDAAAEKVVKEVWGDITGPGQEAPEGLESPSPHNSELSAGHVVTALLDWISTPAQAGANINVSTAAIRQLLGSLRNRANNLKTHLYKGNVGVNANGDLEVRSEQGLSIKDRARVRNLVRADNRDRAALYREIAQANGHPEWTGEIRKRFAAKWISEAKPGWWVQQGGKWRKK